jgi:transposase
MISAVIERCAGIDVGKKFLAVCIMKGPAAENATAELRKFGTVRAELERLREWLKSEGCTHVVKAGAEETDPHDARWLAHWLRHGMIRPSFIPPRAQRELRDLTRRRKRMVRAAAEERNRVQKVLEDANVKIGDVLSDVFGLSGQRMLEALVAGRNGA